jgi:hypothetical protein
MRSFPLDEIAMRSSGRVASRTPKSTVEFRNGENLANNLGASQAGASPVDFELTKRRIRGHFRQFSRECLTSQTQERRGWDSNPRATFAASTSSRGRKIADGQCSSEARERLKSTQSKQYCGMTRECAPPVTYAQLRPSEQLSTCSNERECNERCVQGCTDKN